MAKRLGAVVCVFAGAGRISSLSLLLGDGLPETVVCRSCVVWCA